MIDSADVPLPYRIVALMQERNRLFAYPLEQIAADIWAERFRCGRCGKCCTRELNNHIFLLEHDVENAIGIDPSAIEPAPYPEFCDQEGTLYVSGYALRMRNDREGSCWFLNGGKCRIYEQRFSCCRIYPHMLRRSAGAPGHVSWRHFARRGSHGIKDSEILYEDSLTLAREVKEYENAFLSQQISFLECIHEYFTVQGLRHDPVLLRKRSGGSKNWVPERIKVFHYGQLEEWQD